MFLILNRILQFSLSVNSVYSISAVIQVTLRRDFLDVVEEDYYTALYNESQAQFNT